MWPGVAPLPPAVSPDLTNCSHPSRVRPSDRGPETAVTCLKSRSQKESGQRSGILSVTPLSALSPELQLSLP